MSNEILGTADGADPRTILWVCVKQQTDAAGGVIAIQGDPGERRQPAERGGKCGKVVETKNEKVKHKSNRNCRGQGQNGWGRGSVDRTTEQEHPKAKET